jgi:hypothetical protein
MTRQKIRSATSMMTAEQGLLEEIEPMLKMFYKFKTHRSTKHDNLHSTEKWIISTCAENVSTCDNPIPTSYKGNGRATVWMHKQEVSSDIENTLRNAIHSSDMHQYLQTKYKWEDNTIANIAWMIHSNALQSLAKLQRKTITQFLHDWLPGNGHPGRSNQVANRICPCCRTQHATQGLFMTCDSLEVHWITLIDKILQPFKAHHKVLASILQWALTNCRDHNFPFPTRNEDIQQNDLHPTYTELIRAQSQIGWNQIIRGRWATQWIQHMELVTPEKSEKHLASITTSIWQATIHTWKVRCDTLHQDDTHIEQHTRLHLRPQVLALYEMKPRLDNIDRRV